MIETILLGVLSSHMNEMVAAINKKLQGTLLQGNGAFLVALGMSLAMAIGKEVVTPGFNLSMLTNYATLSATFAEVFAVSQIYFMFVVKKFNLDVQMPDDTAKVAA